MWARRVASLVLFLGVVCAVGVLLDGAGGGGEAQAQTMPLQRLWFPDAGAITGVGSTTAAVCVPPRRYPAIQLKCPNQVLNNTSVVDQQNVTIQNYRAWNGSTQTSNIRVGPSSVRAACGDGGLLCANGIVLEPGAVWPLSVQNGQLYATCELFADAGCCMMGQLCAGGAPK